MAKTKVKITKDTNDRRKCHPDPVNFQAVTGDEVTFEFKDEPNAIIASLLKITTPPLTNLSCSINR